MGRVIGEERVGDVMWVSLECERCEGGLPVEL